MTTPRTGANIRAHEMIVSTIMLRHKACQRAWAEADAESILLALDHAGLKIVPQRASKKPEAE